MSMNNNSTNEKHPLFVDQDKELTRFDLILIDKFNSMENIHNLYRKLNNDFKKFTSKSVDDVNTKTSNNDDIQKIPEIRELGCSLDNDLNIDDNYNPNNHVHSEYFRENSNSYRNSLTSSESYCDSDDDDLHSYSPLLLTKEHHIHPQLKHQNNVKEEEVQDSLSSQQFMSTSLSTIPEVSTPASLGSSEILDQPNNDDQKNIDEKNNGKTLTETTPSKYNTVTFGKKLNKQVTLGAPTTTRHTGSGQSGLIINGSSTVTGASSIAHDIGAGKKNGRAPLFRRHSTYQQKQSQECEMDTLLTETAGSESMLIAFSRSKLWSKYCQIIINFYNQRLKLENEHAIKLQKLVESTRNTLTNEIKNNNGLPLYNHFNEIIDTTEDYSTNVDSVCKTLNEKVVKTLQEKHEDHESIRRTLKQDYAKQEKALNNCISELKRAQRNFDTSQSNYYKARDTTTKSENAINNAGVLGPDHHRKKKEIDKKKKLEEEALQKKTDAESQVNHLKMKKNIIMQNLDDLKLHNIKELCSNIILCDRATQLAASRFSEALSNLWLPLPSKYQELADAARHYKPGSEFMSFLHNLPGRSISSSSLLRNDGTSATTPSEDEHVATTSTGGRSSTASSISGRRRNALNEAEHYDLIIETQQHRKPKRSMGRLFEQGLSSSTEYTEPTKSHKLVRTRQVIKCIQCDRVSLLSETVKCTTCGISWHKKCLPNNTVVCGPNAKPFAESARRVSIFGVPLKNHLELQKRTIPQILEKCIDEIQKRGMKARGIYRTCGVKSKVEQICEMFEQNDGKSDITLDEIHPMNIASVIKLYFRKLPEPLLGYELYNEFLEFDVNMDQLTIITRLQDLLITKLPEQNYETLKYLILHLKRVTWFKSNNLMTSSNLAAVIAPSLIWAPMNTVIQSMNNNNNHKSSFINDAHQQSKIIELVIEHAYEIFEVDAKQDWKEFFQKYSNLKEPEQDDNEQIDYSNVDLGDDEEGFDDDYDGEDEIENTACSSSNVSQQPPTPDLLRPNLNSTNNLKNSADNIHEDYQYQNKKYSPAVRTKSAGNPPEQLSTLEKQFPKEPLKNTDILTKQRSFTTSILVSPQNNRKIFLPQQHSVDSRTRELTEKQQQILSSKIIQSGEVTINMKKDQYFVLSTKPSTEQEIVQEPVQSKPSLNTDRPPIGPKNVSNVPTSSSLPEREQICVNGLGLIFSTGNDVSYV